MEQKNEPSENAVSDSSNNTDDFIYCDRFPHGLYFDFGEGENMIRMWLCVPKGVTTLDELSKLHPQQQEQIPPNQINRYVEK